MPQPPRILSPLSKKPATKSQRVFVTFLPISCRKTREIGAGEGNRTLIASLEG